MSSKTIFCPECGHNDPKPDNYCRHCGLDLEEFQENPVDLILDSKREINGANTYVHERLGQTGGAAIIWCLERVLVILNQLHQWHTENTPDVEF